MSTIDERVVKMTFDNAKFSDGVAQTQKDLESLEKSLKFDGVSSGLEEVQKSISSINLSDMESAVESAGNRFSVFEEIAIGALRRIGSQIADFAANMAKQVTVQPLMDGFSEYETKMGAIQTIMANTGLEGEEGLAQVTAKLDELNTYADKTIYNFADMTRNIGTFTAAGVDLETATTSIQGIANLAALSGSSSQQASTAMYQLSQAIAAGSVKLQDWNSVVNAGMGGKNFQEALKRTARAHGIAVDQIIEDEGSFRESLQQGWITADVLTDTLAQLAISYEEVGDEAYNSAYDTLIHSGYSEEDAVAILKLAKAAEDSATEVRTFSQLIDTTKEQLGSGWTETWEIVVGDFLEAKGLFTDISEAIGEVVLKSSESRNNLLREWSDSGGRDAIIGTIWNLWEAVSKIVGPILDAFHRAFAVTGQELATFTENIARFTKKLVISNELADRLGMVFEGIFTFVHDAMALVLGIFDYIDFGSVMQIVSDITTIALDVFDIVQAIGNMLLSIVDATGLFDAIGISIGWIIDRIADFTHIVSTFITGITDIVSPIFDVISEIFKLIRDLGAAFVDAIGASGPVKAFFDWFQNLHDSIMGFWDGGFKEAVKGIHDFITGLVQGLRDFGKVQNEDGSVIDRVTAFSQKIQESGFAKVVGDVVTAIGDLLSGSEKFFEAAGVMAGGMALLPGPFKAVSAVVGLLVGASGDLKTVFDTLSSLTPNRVAFNALRFGFSNELQNFKNVLAGISPDLANGFSEACNEVLKWIIKITNGADDWGEVLTNIGNDMWEGIKSVPDNIGNWIENIKNSLLGLEDSSESVEGSTGSILDSVNGLRQGLTEKNFDIGSIIKTMFENVGKFLSNGAKIIAEKGSEVASSIKTFFDNFFANLPSPEELAKSLMDIGDSIGKGLGQGIDFIGALLQNFPSAQEIGFAIGEHIGGMLHEIIDSAIGAVSGFFNGLGAGFVGDWSIAAKTAGIIQEDFDTTNPEFDFSQFILSVLNGITDTIYSIINDPRIGTTIDRLFDALIKIFELFIAKNINKLIKSINGISKSIETAIKNAGGMFTNIGNFFKDGGALIKNTTNIFPPESKADAFLKIAGSLALIAGSIWLVVDAANKGDLTQAVVVLGIMGTAIAVIVGIFSYMSTKQADLGKNAAGLGTAFAGIGISLAAIAGALWIITQIPMKDITDRIPLLVGIVGTLIGLFFSVKNSSTNYAGVAAAAIGFAVALTLLLIPITILGLLPWTLIAQGELSILGIALIMGLFIGLTTKLGGTWRQIAALGAAALAFAIAIDLLMIPITMLGLIPWTLILQGELAIAGIALIMGLFFGLTTTFSNGTAAQFIGLGVAAIAFAIAVDLILIPIAILALFPQDQISMATGNVIGIMLFLGLAIVAFGLIAEYGNAGGAVALAAAAIVFAIAIDLLLIPIALLALLPPDRINAATGNVMGIIVVLGLVIAAFALISRLDGMSVAGVLGLAAGMVLVAAAVDLLAVAFIALQGVDLGAIAPVIIGIVIAFAALIAVSAALPIVGPVVLAVGAGLALFGVGVLAVAVALQIMTDVVSEWATKTPAEVVRGGENMGRALAAVLYGFLSQMGEYIAQALSGLMDAIVQGVSDLFAGGIAWCQSIADGFAAAMDWVASGLASLVGIDLKGDIEAAADGAGTGTGEKLANGVNGSINERKADMAATGHAAGTEVGNATADGTNEAISARANELIAKGHEVGKQQGNAIGAGEVEGINEKQPEINQAAQNTGEGAVNSASTAITNGQPQVLNAFNTAFSVPANDSLSALTSQFGIGGEDATNALLEKLGVSEEYRDVMSGNSDAAVSGIEDLKEQFNAMGIEDTEGFISGLGLPDVYNASQGVADQAESGLGTADGRPSGDNLVAGFVGAIWDAVNRNEAGAAASALAAQATNSMNAKLQVNSPSKVTEEIGEYTGEGFVNGIENFIPNAETSGANLSEGAIEGVNSGIKSFDSLKTMRTSFVEPIENLTPDIYEVSYDAGADAAEGFTEGFEENQEPLAVSIDTSSMSMEEWYDQDVFDDVSPVVTPSDLDLSGVGTLDVNGQANVNLPSMDTVNAISNDLKIVSTDIKNLYNETVSLREKLVALSDDINEHAKTLAQPSDVYLDSGALVGAISKQVDSKLGQRGVLVGRGVI